MTEFIILFLTDAHWFCATVAIVEITFIVISLYLKLIKETNEHEY